MHDNHTDYACSRVSSVAPVERSSPAPRSRRWELSYVPEESLCDASESSAFETSSDASETSHAASETTSAPGSETTQTYKSETSKSELAWASDSKMPDADPECDDPDYTSTVDTIKALRLKKWVATQSTDEETSELMDDDETLMRLD